MTVHWWYWLLLGLCLIGAELIVPSFTIIWFGLGALIVGVVQLLWSGFPLWGGLLLWAISSIVFTILWFRYLKPRTDRTKSGLAKEAILGERGMVMRGTGHLYERGRVRFQISLLGADEWDCFADQELQVGDAVRVIDIEGQMLKVEKIS
jgi:membrane protein implicated in regulation of membrane protease activity